jgi:hypothetical protein
MVFLQESFLYSKGFHIISLRDDRATKESIEEVRFICTFFFPLSSFGVILSVILFSLSLSLSLAPFLNL